MVAQLLVVEDNEANLALMAYLLRARGHTVFTARDGEEAIESVGRSRPDLIVCDVQMPNMDGYGVANRLKSQPALRKIPLVAVTALAMVGDRDQVLARGFDAYISKPIDPETFGQQIERLLRKEDAVEPQRQAKQGKVLAVDDVPHNLSFVRSALEPLGYAVFEATNVERALQIAREHTPDLILSDIHMPEKSGIELIKACRNDPHLRRIRIVVMSNTYFTEEDRKECLALGAADFISRPIEASEFIARVERCLQTA